MKKTLVIAHVFYPQLWSELAACVRNIDGERDLIVTYVDGASVVEARRDFPEARFLLCENRGFDIWPFLQAIALVNLSDYGCIVKLHTKRDVLDEVRYRFNHAEFNGSAWRDYLLSFVRTPAAWDRTCRLLKKPDVGMVADRHVVMRRQDVPMERTLDSFDQAMALIGLPESARTRAQYVAGTMFAAKPEALAAVLQLKPSAEDFAPAQGHLTETFAHVMERAIGLSVSAAGLRIAPFSGSLRWRRFYAPALRFLFRVKETRRRKIVKVLGVPVCWRMKDLAV